MLRKVLLLAPIGLALAISAAAAAPMTAISAASIHSDAKQSSPIQGSIVAGATVDVSKCKNGWCLVTGEGWVAAKFLRKAGSNSFASNNSSSNGNGSGGSKKHPSVQIQIGLGGLSFGNGQGGFMGGNGMGGIMMNPQQQQQQQPQQQQQQNPAPAQAAEQKTLNACFFPGRDFTGTPTCAAAGTSIPSINPPMTMQSAKLPGGVIVFSQPNFQGTSVGLNNPASNYDPIVVGSMRPN